MQGLLEISMCIIWFLGQSITGVEHQNSPRRQHNSRTDLDGVQYEYFDDYLLSVAAPPEVSDEDESSQISTDDTDPASTAEILGYFRDVPRQHWSCCMLGKLAGDKGFHCRAEFYAQRIAARNINRAHNRRMRFQGRDAVANWGAGIMRTFSRCVSHHSDEFHKCCYAATVEQRERGRWERFRGFVRAEE